MLTRFEAFQAIRHEPARARTRLSDRKLIERAKGVLMKARKLSEEDAYAALRRMAMERRFYPFGCRNCGWCTAIEHGCARLVWA